MTITSSKRRWKKVVCLIFFVSLFLVLPSSTPRVVFKESPTTSLIWEIHPSQHLGDVITATLRITSAVGVTLDLTGLPDAGDTLRLPGRIVSETGGPHYSPDNYYEIPEGQLEIVSRRIEKHIKGNLVVTEVIYEFLYLDPIDLSFPSDDKRLPWNLSIFQEYFQSDPKSGRVVKNSARPYIEEAEFFIVPRVDENSVPLIKFFRIGPPQNPWPKVRQAGILLLVLSAILFFWRIGTLLKRLRSSEEVITKPPDAGDLFRAWIDNQDPEVFEKALKLYRRGIWGRPQASTWITTTFILYSGVTLSAEHQKSVFAQIVKEVKGDEPSL